MGIDLPNQFSDMEDADFDDSQLAYHVKDILNSVLIGENDLYNQLVGVMHRSRNLQFDEVGLLETSLMALSGAVPCLDITHHESLLSVIFSMSLWNYRPSVMDALVELIVSMAISNGKFVDLSLGMLVSNFMPPPYFLDRLKHPRGLERKYQVTSRVHAALEKITEYVPLAPLRLLPIVLEGMPTIHRNDHAIVIYVENMLKLEGSAIGKLVGGTLLMAVVDRLIDLDVSIGWDEILEEDFCKGIFDMELLDLDQDVDYSEEDGHELHPLSRKSLAGNAIAELLDSLMVMTFGHLESCKDAGRLIEVFETLLQSFQLTVLNAHKSKFAQFVMFYACALDPENCGLRFATVLADIFVHNLHSELTRMSAVAYLASYLSRGKFLSASFVAIILKRLVDWCMEYCKTQEVDVNPKVHRVFYSGCQAIVYVLCFRMKSFMDVARLKSQLLLMPLEAILRHKLSPLKVCLPSVVQEFLRQAKAARLFTVSKTFIFDDLLESELSRAFGGLERLDMFFPFDPCLLKKSDSIIREHYVFWSTVRPKYDDEEGSSDEEDIDEDFVDENEDVLDDGIAGSFDEQELCLDEFDYALNKMSITPKDSFSFKFGGRFQEHTRMPSRIRPSTSPESL
ncbi:hypothetical protein SLA2020_019690 [Shorea laevis]